MSIPAGVTPEMWRALVLLAARNRRRIMDGGTGGVGTDVTGDELLWPDGDVLLWPDGTPMTW